MKSLIKRIIKEETKERNYGNIVKLATNYIKNMDINGLCDVKLIKGVDEIVGVIFTQGHIGDTKIANMQELLEKIFHVGFIIVELWKSSCSEFDKFDKFRLDEGHIVEETSLQTKILKMINVNGFLTVLRSVGGYDNLRKIMKGTDYLSKDVMVDTINEIIGDRGSVGLYDIGLDPITVRTIGNEIHQIDVLVKGGCVVFVYEDYDENDEVMDEYMLSYDDMKRNDLFELFDGVIEYYEQEID